MTNVFCEIVSIQTGAGLSKYVLAVEKCLKHIKANRNYDPNLDRHLCALQAAMEVRKKGVHKMQNNNNTAHKHSLAMAEPEAQKSLPNMQEFQSHSATDMTSVVRYLISRLATIDFQRPCIAEKMTLKGFMKAQLTGSVYVIFIEEHKTASKYLASDAFIKREYNRMCNWYKYVRRAFHPGDEAPTT